MEETWGVVVLLKHCIALEFGKGGRGEMTLMWSVLMDWQNGLFLFSFPLCPLFFTIRRKH